MSLRVGVLLLATGGLLLGAAAPGRAQSRGALDETDLALAWARGGFASSVVCRFQGGAKRGLRRVIIAEGPATSEERVDRIQFVDLGADGADGCVDELGADEPNVIGAIYVTHKTRRPNSDTAERDFKHDVEHGPIPFDVVRGRLRVGRAGGATDTLKDVDFAGAKMTLEKIQPGSDEARVIADLPGGRQLRLAIDAKDGTHLALPLVEMEKR
jgi:hypothetical protein